MLYGDIVVFCMETVLCVVWNQCSVLYGDNVVCYMDTV